MNSSHPENFPGKIKKSQKVHTMENQSVLPAPIPLTGQKWAKGTMPLVSISCITYNHEAFIRDAIEGFLMQKTTFPVEILIHDDASTDGTAKIVREYEEKYPGLIFPIYQTENLYSQGIKISINFQYPRASSKYIALCEGDDYWTDPLKLQKQVDFLESHEEYTACITHAKVSNEIENKSYPYKILIEEGDVPLEKIIERGGAIYPTASIVFRKSCVESEIFKRLINANLSGDTILIITARLLGKVFFMNHTTCVYRRWPGGMYSSIAGRPQLEANWKTEAINGYKMLKKLVNGKIKQQVQKKISSESLFILRYSQKPSRFLYLGNLTFSDFQTYIRDYIKPSG